jgi:hypothetical protein
MGADWKAIIRGVAPVLGTIISGGNPLAGGAIRVLTDALLPGKENATEEDLAEFVQTARPEDLVPLKQIEADYRKKMAELGLRPLELEIQDRASARELFKVDSKPQRNITYLFLGGYFLVLLLLVGSSIIGKSVNFPTEFAVVFGVLSGAVPSILAFWFGSTKGSAEKTQALAMSKPAFDEAARSGADQP